MLSHSNDILWQYSAKIFTYIDRKLQLLTMIKDFHGQLPSIDDYDKFDEDISTIIDQYDEFDKHIEQLNDYSQKIEHIMITRIHMHLLLSMNDKEQIEQFLVRATGHTNIYKYKVDNALIAGVRLQSETLLWEHSIAKQLRQLEISLER